MAAYRHQFPILHLKEKIAGLSRARNIGRQHVQGEIVAFPDDDCIYPEDLLAKITLAFHCKQKWDSVITQIYDLDEDKNAFDFFAADEQSGEIDYIKGYRVGVSIAMFFRTHVTRQLSFDETIGLGPGKRWATGEDTNYLLQCVDAGYRCYYDAALIVRHPSPVKQNNCRKQLQREYAYGLGKGYFLGTHRLPRTLFMSEYRASERYKLSKIFNGNFLCHIPYLLMHGIGVLFGYRAALKKKSHPNK